jgi:hypothetical protein
MAGNYITGLKEVWLLLNFESGKQAGLLEFMVYPPKNLWALGTMYILK